MYGLTEATSPTHMTPHGRAPPVDPRTGVMSIGVPVFNTDVRVVPTADAKRGPAKMGELVIAGPQIVRATGGSRARRPKSLWTGRAAHRRRGLHGRGRLVLSGRPGQGHDHRVGIQGVAPGSRGGAVSPPGSTRGGGRRHSRPVSRRDHQGGGQSEAGAQCHRDDIKAFARERLAAYKYPRVVEIIDDLPKTASGKIMRRLLHGPRGQAAA